MTSMLLKEFALRTLLLCTCFSLGCASKQEGEVPAKYLEPAGWFEPNQVLKGNKFADYVKATKQLVAEYRVYLDTAKAVDNATELLAVIPKEYEPAPECSSAEPRGIAILVHGLSDTAFAMQDLAEHLASTCFIARTVLLPGHGTRPGDLLVVDHHDWLDNLRYLTQQAAAENDNIILVGFSLGAALTLTVATEKDSSVKSVIGISPAYSIAASRLARLSPFVDWAIPWLIKSPPDDFVRYGTAPLRSVSETVGAIRHMKSVLKLSEAVEQPWLLIQSMDDSVVQPATNMDFHSTFAKNDKSRIVNFHSDNADVEQDERAMWIRGDNQALRVEGLTHVSVHISPKNNHYGVNGDYRNCGLRSPRSAKNVERCENAESVVYGLWNKAETTDDIWAVSTFNPNFKAFTDQIDLFLAEP